LKFKDIKSQDCTLRWLIEEIAVANQPLLVGGPSKALKTLTGMDAALSMASGTPLFGKYRVPQRKRCLVLSGEMAPATLIDALRVMCRARGVDPDSIHEWLIFGENMPQITNAMHMASLREDIERFQADVLMLDPTYLAMMSGDVEVDPKNYMKMGELLFRFSRVCLDGGCTPLLFAHFRTTVPFGKEPTLADIAYAGFQQFSRQWILLSRRSEFDPTPVTEQNELRNELWFVAGGSSVPGKRLALDVYEGIRDREFKGYSWRVDVHNVTEAKQNKTTEAVQERIDAGKKRKDIRRKQDENDVLLTVDAMAARRELATRRKIRTTLGWGADKADGAIDRLLADDILEELEKRILVGCSEKKQSYIRRKTAQDPDFEMA
jgi:hypothetical protein